MPRLDETQLTSEEIIAEVHNRLGFYVIEGPGKYPIGFIIPVGSLLGKGGVPVQIPLRIVRESTREAFAMCTDVIAELDRETKAFYRGENGTYFYEVEACD